MKKSPDSRYLKILLLFLFVVPAKAQTLNQNRDETCGGLVFSARDLLRRATITSHPTPTMTQEALAQDVHGRVVLEAILCRTGRVTDIRIVEGLPLGMTEKALEAVRQTRFIPAEMDFHTVSQRIRFEFHFNERGLDEIAALDAEGRTVEAIEIMGNRRLAADEIMNLIHTRLGDIFREEEIKKDLQRILATGNFDSRNTRIQMEERPSGGVVIILEVNELPMISEVKLEGLKDVDESVIVEALRKEEIDVRQWGVYDPVKEKRAINVIRSVVASHGQKDVVVEVRSEEVTATSMMLTFVISSQ